MDALDALDAMDAMEDIDFWVALSVNSEFKHDLRTIVVNALQLDTNDMMMMVMVMTRNRWWWWWWWPPAMKRIGIFQMEWYVIIIIYYSMATSSVMPSCAQEVAGSHNFTPSPFKILQNWSTFPCKVFDCRLCTHGVRFPFPTTYFWKKKRNSNYM